MLLTSLLWSLTACDKDKEQNPGDDTHTRDTAAPDSEVPGDSDSDGGGDDSGDGGGDDSEPPPCETTLDETLPEEGDVWFYRDAMALEFDGDGSSAAITLTHVESGIPVGWDKSGTEWFNENTEVTLVPAAPLQSNSEYLLSVEICDVTTEVHFTTDAYGDPVSGGAKSLLSRTWVVELSEVEYTEPAGIGFLLSGTLTVPILVGVTEVGETSIDLLGAQGILHRAGYYYQDASMDTWDFSGAIWEDPFFSVDSDVVDLEYDEIHIPIYGFHLEGTFAPDGSSIGGGKLWGLGDTRELGAFIGSTSDDSDAVCSLLELSGVYCEECPSDKMPYCLFLKAEDIFAAEEPDLTLEPIGSEDSGG